MSTKWTIRRVSENLFSAVSNVLMSDGSYREDSEMSLVGNVLRSASRPGLIRVDGLLKLVLGLKSLAAVRALAIGDSVNL
jgi:hypothetical protein